MKRYQVTYSVLISAETPREAVNEAQSMIASLPEDMEASVTELYTASVGEDE